MHLENFGPQKHWYHALTTVPGVHRAFLDISLCSLAVNFLALATPLTLMQVYDRVLPFEAGNTLIWISVAAAVALVLECFLRIVRAFSSAWVAARFEHLVGCEAVEKILDCSIESFNRVGLARHLERLNAPAALRSFYAGQMFQMLLDLPFAALFLAAIWYVAGNLVLFPVVVFAAYIFVVYLTRRKFLLQREVQNDVQARRLDFLVELLGGIHILKAQAFEEQMLRRYEQLQGSIAESNLSVARWSSLPVNLGSIVSHIIVFGVIAIGGSQVIEGNLSLGALAACMILGSRALQPIRGAATFWLHFSDAEIALKRLGELESLETIGESQKLSLPSDIEGAVELRDVPCEPDDSESDQSARISLKISAGEMVAFVAARSPHATNLAHLMKGLTQPGSGRVLIDGYNLESCDAKELAGRVEYLSQTSELFRGSILDNISMFQPHQHAAAKNAAAALGLDNLIALLPRGYDTEVGSQASTLLPNGLIQLISVARALVVRPRILIFDRTELAMDFDSRFLLIRLLRRLKGHCTIICITDDPEVLGLSDSLYEVDRIGLRVYDGS